MEYSAYVLGALFGVSELALSLFKRSKSDASSKDRSSLALIWIVIGVAMFVAFALSRQGPWLPASAVLYPIGIVLTLGGIALRWFAILWLGRWFTVNVAIAADQPVVDTGPYRFVRHPSYTGALAAFLGLGLCIGHWLSLVIIMLPATAVFLWRIHIEEAAMAEAFGPRWSAYAARTRRLLPGIY
ncbi:methyltransferase family protein [Pinirhizobacter soli]|uniref:methyltransferase family protein n=1 Tax=Pinirhizobacter soli TaxID=2786953 RepID=UPI00202A908E|nr:isoprenylcysteine carboxylmethyltransferase family protein [Pinirhizobacter soli]